jgi:hypothetical protein
MSSAYLADAVVALHAAYVGFVVLGFVLILLGGLLGWQWVRNWWFRLAHLAAITFVAFEAIIGMDCPLTVWEADLRRAAGQEVTEGTFIGRYLHELIFFNWPEWVFTILYLGFALLVLATLYLVPPGRKRPGATPGDTAPAVSGAAGSPRA